MHLLNISRWTLPVFVLLCLIWEGSAVSNGYILLDIPQGKVLGRVMSSRDGKAYSGFMGIPFAQQPERFEPAKLPPPSWENIYDGTQYRSGCLQVNPFTGIPVGSEDCLFVNVFTPNVTGNLTVMAYIHGGAFMAGSSSEYGSEHILDHEVIYVSFNYRVAAFGFLSTEDDILPGNLGLKDQNLALRWIQDNIGYFGGDKNRVTLFGESAGAGSVALHVVSKQSDGLYRYAISESSSAFNRWVIEPKPKSVAEKLATRLNCPTSSSREIIDCLKQKSGTEIVTVELRDDLVLESPAVYAPVVESSDKIPADSVFLPDHPRNLYDQGLISKVPMMMTFCDMEGLLLNSIAVINSGASVDAFNTNWTQTAATAFLLNHPDHSQQAITYATDKLRDFYFGSKPVSNETFLNLTDLFSDSGFTHGIRRASLAHAKYAPVYTAVLGFKGFWSYTFLFGFTEILGMTHGDDLFYLFTDLNKFPPIPPRSESDEFSKFLVKLWVNFANTGDPEYEVDGQKWLPMQQEEIDTGVVNYLYLKDRSEFVSGLYGDRMLLWDHIDEVLESGVIP